MIRHRFESLRNTVKGKDVDAFLITKKENIDYILEFRGEGILLVASEGKSHFITDSRFAQRAKEDLGGFKIHIADKTLLDAIKKFIKKAKIKRLGFESRWISAAESASLSSGMNSVKFIPCENIVEEMRMIKDGREIGLIKKSISITKKAFFYIKKALKSGMTGKEISARIDAFLRSQGAERIAFDTIVLSPPDSSHPHGPTSNKRVSKKGMVLIDMGCVRKGYHSDLTRVFFPGTISAKFKKIYDVVKKAQDAAIEKIRAGARISEIDRAARDYIENRGFGKFFIHSLGHGIGLEGHESPRIAGSNERPLRPGMVFTVEPGIYIPGWGGVRLEDMVLVTKHGCEILTKGIPR